jgi:hypothetical protein
VLDVFSNTSVRVFAWIHMGHNGAYDSSRPIFNKNTDSFEVEEEHGTLTALGRGAIVPINDVGESETTATRATSRSAASWTQASYGTSPSRSSKLATQR